MEVFGIPAQAWLGQILLGLMNGSFYAVLSLGLAVIFGLLNIINFAHGALYMFGAFCAWMGLSWLGVGYWWSLLLSPVVVGAFGVVLERLLLRRLYELDHMYGLLLTFGLALIIEGVFRHFFGVAGQPYPVPDLLRGATDVGFMMLPTYRAWVVVTVHHPPKLASLADMLQRHARLTPHKVGARDLERELSFREWNRRSTRLANALLGMGLSPGDRVCVLAYNAIEWVEIYAATAIAGLIAVPINFRLIGSEISFIANNCGATAFIVQQQLVGVIEPVRKDIGCPEANYVLFGSKAKVAGFRDYEDLALAGSEFPPAHRPAPSDTWALMYTSGTTGKPKGAIRSHQGSAMLSLVTCVEIGLSQQDNGLLVMPMCHANSLYFLGAFLYTGATTFVYDRKSFDPEHLLRTLAGGAASFTSLVPTHYNMILSLPAATRAHYDVDRVRKLVISSAPARQDTKLGVMEHFRNSGLYEMYGSTEIGFATMLHPEHQLTKLGSVGRECVGTQRIRLLDADGREVEDGQTGELYSQTGFAFDGYWCLPEKTREAFLDDGYCTVGDFARRDDDGFIFLVDRKSNMIISGGENVYPSEVEGQIATHPKVKEVAVIGLPDEKWGERVHAVVVPAEGHSLTPDELLAWCKERLAGYKRPRSWSFIQEEDMPRTATGKIMHRVLRDTQTKTPKNQ